MQEFDRREAREKKMMGSIFMGLGIFVIILSVTAVILGYFVSFKSNDGDMRDGFGRLIVDLPVALSFMKQWAGHIWLIIDCLILLGAVVIIDKLFMKSKNYFTGTKNVDF